MIFLLVVVNHARQNLPRDEATRQNLPRDEAKLPRENDSEHDRSTRLARPREGRPLMGRQLSGERLGERSWGGMGRTEAMRQICLADEAILPRHEAILPRVIDYDN